MTDNKASAFCHECGAHLRAWDFRSGRAVLEGEQARCATCPPAPIPQLPPLPPVTRETRWRARRNRQVL